MKKSRTTKNQQPRAALTAHKKKTDIPHIKSRGPANRRITSRAVRDSLGHLPPDPDYLDAPEATPAARVMENLLASLKLGDHIRNRAIREAWPALVGEYLARESHPDALRRGVLTVRVGDPATHHHLRALKHELLAALRGRLDTGNEITDIRFLH